ncbi:MAG TPA: hypothetical protein VI636_17155 [Candidatus Angelobacter sp.]
MRGQLSTMIDAEKMDQRTWIKVKTGDVTIKSETPITSMPSISNTGKTPALHVIGVAVMRVVGTGQDIQPQDFTYPHGNVLAVGILLPNDSPADFLVYLPDTARLKDGVPQPTITTREIFNDIVTNGTSYLILYGKITYDDAMGDHHWLTFCGISQTGNKVETLPIVCLDYNNFDHQ